MKRLLGILTCICALLGTGAHTYAQAPGEACSTAIPLGKDDYSVSVKNGMSVWYSAWTFDLPLSVYFAPKNGASDPAPVVEMDFSCTSGYYEDSILCSLFCKTSGGSGVSFDMPHKPSLNTKTLDDGTFVYFLSLGKQYRDLLLQMGISYNVEVFVHVTYKSDGVISMAPDDMFTSCVDKAKFMHLGDTFNVQAQDKKRHVIVPYVQWQEDTIIYQWTGTTPCTLTVANTCDFDPTDQEDGNIIQFSTIEPGDTSKILAEKLQDWVSNKEFPNEAGMYFAKTYSDAPGHIKVFKAPQAPPRGNATLLRYDRTYALNANETGVFAIPTSWNNNKVDSKFSSPTSHLFSMIIATDPDFAEEHVLKQYDFEKTPKGRWIGIHGTEMRSLWNQTSEQYLYIRFICSEATTVTPAKWDEVVCDQAVIINVLNKPDTTFTVKRGSTGGYYKINYCKLQGGDLTFKFSNKKNCYIYVATDCNIDGTSTAPNLLYYYKLNTSTNITTVPADEIANWAERLNDEGYVFMRFHHTESVGSYKMTLQSTAPEDADPTYPASTISVVCEGSKVLVYVTKPQHITVYDSQSTEQAVWDAETETPKELILPAGKYTLVGESEKIEINL